MRRTISMAAAIAALLCAASAYAQAPVYQPADSIPQLGQVLPIARGAWPDSRCNGREMVAIIPAPLLNPTNGQHTVGLASDAAGGCWVQLEDSIINQPVVLCWVVSHELGHLSGIWEHSPDPNNIMSEGSRYPPCAALQPTPIAVPPPYPQPANPPATTMLPTLEQAEKQATRLLSKRYRAYRHGRARDVSCWYVREAITCDAAWRYKRASYRGHVRFTAADTKTSARRVSRT